MLFTLRQLVFPIYSPLQRWCIEGHRPFDHSDSSDEIRLKSFHLFHTETKYMDGEKQWLSGMCIRYTSNAHSLKWITSKKYYLFTSSRRGSLPHSLRKIFQNFFFFLRWIVIDPLSVQMVPPPPRRNPLEGGSRRTVFSLNRFLYRNI